jgi:membrane protein implicated in regulation of membrane protease activity
MALVVALLLALLYLEPPWSFLAVVGGAAVEVGESVFWIRLSRRRRPAVGVETLIGKEGLVVVACRPEGQVKVDGELWTARCPGGAGEGKRVRVLELDGLTLLVEPAA